MIRVLCGGIVFSMVKLAQFCLALFCARVFIANAVRCDIDPTSAKEPSQCSIGHRAKAPFYSFQQHIAASHSLSRARSLARSSLDNLLDNRQSWRVVGYLEHLRA